MAKQKYSQTTVSTTTSDGSKTVQKVSGRKNYRSTKLWAKRDRKRQEADERQSKYDRLTLTQQLATCVSGGSIRQRAKIEALMAKAAAKNPVKVPAPVVEPAAKVKRVKKVRVTPKE